MTTPAAILGSETHVMTSQQNGRTYQITVSLPLGYDAPPGADWPVHDIPAQWPTVYVLDGDWYSAMVAGIIRPMSWCGNTSDAIVVGIGYPEDTDPKESFRVSFVRRDHDLTPIKDEATQKAMEAAHKRPVPNGDATGFHNFLKQELIPFIETTYRADPARRVLVGHSYGGLFALFGMFITPDLFRALVIGSPTLSYGNRWTFQQEEAFAKEQRRIPASVYLFVGELEESLTDQTVTDTLRMGAILQGRQYEGFSLVKRVFEDQGHCEVAAPGMQWGLKHALKKHAGSE
jgi:predicted alpha/beta superfamily hydrolase